MPEDLEDDGERGMGALRARTRIFLDVPGTDGKPVINKEETTALEEGGMTESVDITLTAASGCRHILHTGAEVGGVCADPACRRVLCAECAKKETSLCAGCGSLVCGACQKKIWLHSEEEVFCRACARRWWVHELLAAGLAGALVYLLLALLLGM